MTALRPNRPVLLLLALSVTFVVGCSGNKESQNVLKFTSPLSKQPTTDTWKTYESRGGRVFQTDNWVAFSPPRTGTPTIPFSFKYPGNWTTSPGGQVFSDSKEEKVAELAPGAVLLKPGQQCRRTKDSDTDLVSQEDISVGDVKGVKTVETVFYETGYGEILVYRTTYCLTRENKAFRMNFIIPEEFDHDKAELFEKIIRTFKFK